MSWERSSARYTVKSSVNESCYTAVRGCTQFCKHLERAHIVFPSQRDKGARTLITQTQGYADESQDGVLGGLMIPSEKGECSNAGGGILNTQTICFGFSPLGTYFYIQFYLGIIHLD